MNVIPVADLESLGEVAAAYLITQLTRNPKLSFTTPTGQTPVHLYRRLREEGRRGAMELEQARIFMLDEYVDLPHYPRASFVEYLHQHLGPLAFNQHTTFNALTPNYAQAPQQYDELLDAAGGLDLAVLGLGRNGHIGFNEPGSTISQRTHMVRLTADTVNVNFATIPESERPSMAITVGIADLLDARSILLLIAGHGKAEVTDALLAGSADERIPVTFLARHPNLTIIIEEHLLRGEGQST